MANDCYEQSMHFPPLIRAWVWAVRGHFPRQHKHMLVARDFWVLLLCGVPVLEDAIFHPGVPACVVIS